LVGRYGTVPVPTWYLPVGTYLRVTLNVKTVSISGPAKKTDPTGEDTNTGTGTGDPDAEDKVIMGNGAEDSQGKFLLVGGGTYLGSRYLPT